jgi:spermidine/putrescine transport system permease protein
VTATAGPPDARGGQTAGPAGGPAGGGPGRGRARQPTRRRARLPRFAPAAPAWAWYLLFFLVPLAVIAVYSLGYKPPQGTGGSIGLDRLTLDNYATALGDDVFAATFLATLRVAALGTALCLLIAFPVAYWLATRVDPRLRGLFLGLLIVPFWTSYLLRTFGWRLALAGRGFPSEILQDLGVLSGPLSLLDTRLAVQIGVVYNYLPLMIFPLFVALDRLDPALREASKDLGATRVRTFVQVTLPLAMPGIVAGLLLVFIPLSGEYVTPAILGGARGLMAGSLVASQFLEAQNWALGSAMALVLIAMVLVTIGVLALVGVGIRTLVRRARRVELAAPAPATRPATGRATP